MKNAMDSSLNFASMTSVEPQDYFSTICLEKDTQHHVVVAVEWGDLSLDSFLWYVQFLHRQDDFVHIVHVPDFRTHIHSQMSPMQVLEVMITTNAVSDELKKKYENILKEKKIRGKFMRVGGNNRSSAIIAYCKLVKASLLVIGTRPTPEATAVSETNSAGSTRSSFDSTTRRSHLSFEMVLQDVGPHPGTLTFDVMLNIDIPVAVYRQPVGRRKSDAPRKHVCKVPPLDNLQETQDEYVFK